jgi:hypothetical protein
MEATMNGAADTIVAQARRIEAEALSRVENISTIEEGLSVLEWIVRQFAIRLAEQLWLKVTAEPGWTLEQANEAGDAIMHLHAEGILESLLAHGGDAEAAGSLIEASMNAFGARLRELEAGPGWGGCA